MAIPQALGTLLAFMYSTHIASVLTGNDSWVDRAWSIAPVVYAALLSPRTPRGFAVLAIITVWGSRLTYNFWRKDGYSIKNEDHRWGYIRDILPPFLHTPFRVFFICFFQNVLLFLIALPTHFIGDASTSSVWDATDTIASLCLLSILAFQAVADQQQWTFHQRKHAGGVERKEQGGLGFCTSGLWRYSRHPNFVAEQSFWIGVWAWAYLAAGASEDVLWAGTGPGLLVLLFQGSTAFTEWISAKKYPEYEIYQRTTSRLIPWIPGLPIESFRSST
ncbi:hypothetical protein HKX48_008964 [Thoreauomyces humboldtii]|nr:hypothetical protein HKX48_008964 [Thoreauomyces humboldtii]